MERDQGPCCDGKVQVIDVRVLEDADQEVQENMGH